MKCSLNGITIISSDLEGDIRIASEAGFEGVEIWRQLFRPKLEEFLSKKTAKDLAGLLNSYNLEPVSICPFLNMFFSSNDEQKRNINVFKEMLNVANVIGCGLLVVCPEEIHEVEPRKIKRTASRILRFLGDLAEEHGIKIGFEFRGVETNFTPDLGSSIELINEVNHDSVGLIVDTAHFFKSRSSLKDLESVDIRELLLLQVEDLKPLPIDKIDVDNDRLYLGEGIIPLRNILKIVKDKGYSDFISFETFATYWNEDPFAVASKARESLNALLTQL